MVSWCYGIVRTLYSEKLVNNERLGFGWPRGYSFQSVILLFQCSASSVPYMNSVMPGRSFPDLNLFNGCGWNHWQAEI